MSLHRETNQEPETGWPAYTNTGAPARPEPDPSPPEPGHAGHHQRGHQGPGGMHKWMMLLMCLPLVLIGVWSFATGGGGAGLIGGLVCMAMMAVMHFAMGGMGRGSGH
jgi:hypothetical protein